MARSPRNPVKARYGLEKGLRGRLAMYVPHLMEAPGKAELEHNPKNNRMRALSPFFLRPEARAGGNNSLKTT